MSDVRAALPVSRVSPGSVYFYREGLAALPESFRNRSVADVTPLVLDCLCAELRAGFSIG